MARVDLRTMAPGIPIVGDNSAGGPKGPASFGALRIRFPEG